MTAASGQGTSHNEERSLRNETFTRSAAGKKFSLASQELFTAVCSQTHRSASPSLHFADSLSCCARCALLHGDIALPAKDTHGRREDSAIRDFQRALGRSLCRRADREDAQLCVQNNRLG